ncbi:MAG: acetyl-CoA carboxylase biotin carboxyl carrier protein [Sphaerochaetaceae bacterium]
MDFETLQQLITMFESSALSELEYEDQQFRAAFKRACTVPVVAAQSVQPVQQIKETKTITSPLVGTFYRTPSPDAPAYVEVGDTIHKGEVLCTLEAMKLMNQLEAEFDCEIVSIYPGQGTLVEFGQPLFEVKLL